MQTVQVRTTQNVFIDYPIASLGDRMLAFLIDAVILTAYNVLCYYVLSKVHIYYESVNIMIVTIPFFLYHPLFEIFMGGQSPGKRQMKIKVVSLDGSSPTVGNYLMRWVFRLGEIFVLRGALAMVTIAANGKGQRLGDVVAGTTVVKLIPQEAVTAQSVFLQLESGYEPVFPQAVQLSDHDVELIQQALTVNLDALNPEPVELAARKVKELIGIESDMIPMKFLYTVLKDHMHYTMQGASK